MKSIGDEKTVPTRQPSDTSASGPLQLGTTFADYRIVRLLGRGGMGVVYEAEHDVLGRKFAVKVLPPDFAGRPNAFERFRREARVMATLNHECILRVDDFRETDGLYWLRMEIAPGLSIYGSPIISLRDLALNGEGKVKESILAEVLEDVLDGLSFAHAQGVVHRDLKPGNILFGAERAKIADFGLVRLVGEQWLLSQAELTMQHSMASIGDIATQSPSAAGTSTQAMLGTYEYMSPEQKHGGQVDCRSDIYAVGLMVYKLLTGQELSLKRPSQIDSSLSEVWDGIAARALDNDPDERYQTVDELIADFRRVKTELRARAKAAAEAKREEDAHRQREEREQQLAAERARQKAKNVEPKKPEKRGFWSRLLGD